MFPSTLEVLEKTNESIFCFGNTVGLISVVSIVILLNVYIHQLLQVSLLIAEIFMAGSSIRMRRVRSSCIFISPQAFTCRTTRLLQVHNIDVVFRIESTRREVVQRNLLQESEATTKL